MNTETNIEETTTEQTEAVKYIESDGMLLDPETGEIVGYVAPDGGEILTAEEIPVDGGIDEGYANWILKSMLKRKARIASFKAEQEKALEIRQRLIDEAMQAYLSSPEGLEVDSIIARCTSVMSKASKELAFFENRFASALYEFAKSKLAGVKDRTWTSPFGVLKLRASKAKLEIADKPKFIAWALKNCPEAIKMEPLISKVPKNTVAVEDIPADGDDEPINGNGLKLVPATESLTIEVTA